MSIDNEHADDREETPDADAALPESATGDGSDAQHPEGAPAKPSAPDERTAAASAFDDPSAQTAEDADDEKEPDAPADEAEPEAKADEEKPEPTEEPATAAAKPEEGKAAAVTVPEKPEEAAKVPRRLLRQTLEAAIKTTADLKPRAKIADDIAKHIGEAGIDGKGLYNLVEMVRAVNTAKSTEDAAMPFLEEALAVRTEGKARTMSAADKARVLREMADRLSPAPKKAELPADLAALVETGALKPEQAQLLADTEARGKQPEPTPEPRAEQPRPRFSPEDIDRGASEVVKVEREMRAKYPQEFSRWLAEIREETDTIRELPPAKWAAQVRKEFDLRIARRAPAKVPTKSPKPSGAGTKPPGKPNERDAVLAAFDA